MNTHLHICTTTHCDHPLMTAGQFNDNPYTRIDCVTGQKYLIDYTADAVVRIPVDVVDDNQAMLAEHARRRNVRRAFMAEQAARNSRYFNDLEEF